MLYSFLCFSSCYLPLLIFSSHAQRRQMLFFSLSVGWPGRRGSHFAFIIILSVCSYYCIYILYCIWCNTPAESQQSESECVYILYIYAEYDILYNYSLSLSTCTTQQHTHTRLFLLLLYNSSDVATTV